MTHVTWNGPDAGFEKAFSNALVDVTFKGFTGGRPPDPVFPLVCPCNIFVPFPLIVKASHICPKIFHFGLCIHWEAAMGCSVIAMIRL